MKRVINWYNWLIGAILHNWCHSTYLYDRQFVTWKLFSFLFPLDKVDYGWYITCSVGVKNKSGWKFAF